MQEAMTRRLSVSFALLAAGAALLVAAGLAYSATESRKGGTLRLSRHTDIDFVDPALAYYSTSWPLLYVTCAKLFNYPDAPGAAGLRLIPEVVKAYTVSRDGRTYSFDLRRTFRFHTGAQVTARSFVDAFNRVAQPKLRSPATAYLHEIVGADAVIGGKAKTISGVRELTRYRLQIRLTKPVGDFTARLTMPFFCPILPNTPVDPNGIDNPPGSGPYYVAERIVNQRVTLRRNPYYRGDRPGNVDEIVWTFGMSQEECLAATEDDRIDLCVEFGIPQTAYRRLAAEHGVNRPDGRFFASPRIDVWYFAFNHDRLAFNGGGQIPLKKAINYVLDRRALGETFGYLGGTPDDQLMTPVMGRGARIYPLAGDTASARKWYARAARKPAKLVLYAFTDRPGNIAAAQVFTSSLKRIGIDVEVKYFEQLTHFEKTGTRGEPFDVAMLAWTTDYADPASFFEYFLDSKIEPTGNSNISYFVRPWVDARIEAAGPLRGAARRKAWADLDVDLMRNDPPWAPYFHTTRPNFVSQSYGCFLYHPFYGVDFAAACKK
jgi:ABC-type oligopeptide transport system substrate-binding subunit